MRPARRVMLGALVLCAAIIAAATSAPAETARTPARVLPFRPGLGPAGAVPATPPPLHDEQKKQVPKPPPSSPPDANPPASSSDHEDKSGGNDCFTNCLSSMFDSIFFGSSSSAPSPAPAPPPPAPGIAPAAETSPGWGIGERGWVRPGAEPDSVTLWDRPPTDTTSRSPAGRLARGVEVVVSEMHLAVGGLWLRVRPADGDGPIGWLADSELESAPPTPAVPAAIEPPPPSIPPAPLERSRQRWSLVLGWGGGGPGDLNVEYGDGAFRGELGYARLFKGWEAGLAAGYRDFSGGRPGFLYVGSKEVDEPYRSTLEMLDVGVRFGQCVGGRGEGLRFIWSLGPSLVRVKEWAAVRILDVTPPMAQIGAKEEWLARWRPAGTARLGLGVGRAGSPGFTVALIFDGYVISWEGLRQRSLTTDYEGKRSLYGVDVSLALFHDRR